MRGLLCTGFAILFALTPPYASWFDDGTFEVPPWAFTLAETGVGTATSTQNATGGNPDDFRLDEISFSGTQFDSGRAAVIAVDEDAAWTGIGESGWLIRFECDQYWSGGNLLGHQPLIFQDGKYYLGPHLDVTLILDEWVHGEKEGISLLDFDQISLLNLSIDETKHPRAANVNHVIYFGYILWGEKIELGATTDGSMGIDNWSIETYEPDL